MLSLLLLLMMMMVVAVLLPNMCTMTMRSFLGRPSRTHQAIPVFEIGVDVHGQRRFMNHER